MCCVCCKWESAACKPNTCPRARAGRWGVTRTALFVIVTCTYVRIPALNPALNMSCFLLCSHAHARAAAAAAANCSYGLNVEAVWGGCAGKGALCDAGGCGGDCHTAPSASKDQPSCRHWKAFVARLLSALQHLSGWTCGEKRAGPGMGHGAVARQPCVMRHDSCHVPKQAGEQRVHCTRPPAPRCTPAHPSTTPAGASAPRSAHLHPQLPVRCRHGGLRHGPRCHAGRAHAEQRAHALVHLAQGPGREDAPHLPRAHPAARQPPAACVRARARACVRPQPSHRPTPRISTARCMAAPHTQPTCRAARSHLCTAPNQREHAAGPPTWPLPAPAALPSRSTCARQPPRRPAERGRWVPVTRA